MKKPPHVVAIDSRRRAPRSPEGPPAKPAQQRKSFSDPQTVWAFCGVFFKMPWDFSKAAVRTRCAPSAASAVLRELALPGFERLDAERKKAA